MAFRDVMIRLTQSCLLVFVAGLLGPLMLLGCQTVDKPTSRPDAIPEACSRPLSVEQLASLQPEPQLTSCLAFVAKSGTPPKKVNYYIGRLLAQTGSLEDAEQWFSEGQSAGDLPSTIALAYLRDTYRSGPETGFLGKTSRRAVNDGVAAGYTPAMLLLAFDLFMLETPLTLNSRIRIRELLEGAAAVGDPLAHYDLGLLYLYRENDHARGLEHLEAAAAGGVLPAWEKLLELGSITQLPEGTGLMPFQSGSPDEIVFQQP